MREAPPVVPFKAGFKGKPRGNQPFWGVPNKGCLKILPAGAALLMLPVCQDKGVPNISPLLGGFKENQLKTAFLRRETYPQLDKKISVSLTERLAGETFLLQNWHVGIHVPFVIPCVDFLNLHHSHGSRNRTSRNAGGFVEGPDRFIASTLRPFPRLPSKVDLKVTKVMSTSKKKTWGIWLWLKKPVPKWLVEIWVPKPAVCPCCLILSHIHRQIPGSHQACKGFI